MGKLHKKVVAVLRPHLAEFEDALEDLPHGRISGVVISSTFTSMSHQSRQRRLNAILKERLTADEFLAIGAIAALTPAEANVKAV